MPSAALLRHISFAPPEFAEALRRENFRFLSSIFPYPLLTAMPAPAVYVVVVLSTTVAAVAFKQFVFDPHLRPIISAWWESRRRRRAPILISVHPRSDSSDDDEPHAHGDSRPFVRRTSLSSDHSNSPIELEELVAREVDEWRSGVDVNRDESGLRLRHTRGPSSSQTLSTPNYMDEHEHESVSIPPMQPTRSQGSREVLFEYPQSPILHPQSSSIISQSGTLHSIEALTIPHEQHTPLNPFDLESAPGSSPSSTLWQSADSVATLSVRVPSPSGSQRTLYPPLPASPDAAPLSNTPPSSPALSPAFFPRISVDVLSAPSSRSDSPFSDSPFSDVSNRALSPGVLLSPPSVHSDFAMPSDDDDMFSLPSNVSSAAVTDEEDAFDMASVQGSETSSWAGVDAHDASGPSHR
ncbi:hypothetical protein EW146_g2428 [Bondarzewia mesenterica]|uniref:Uncharacterized protein n=1 Tax=Bondarzewia mesenterica TaxID=1095465 RepID=A0A4S4M0P8_9AGAM|nr:hypothetical protein EW146_g2428 [Bondarzewia mesenterica]